MSDITKQNPYGFNLRPAPSIERHYSDDPPPLDAQGLRLDGPTMEEWLAAGYRRENYPPRGYAPKPSRRR